jgi:hypothetical protein
MKKSFILYNDSLKVLDELTDEQAGVLFKAIFKYQNGIETDLDFGLKMAFLPFKNQFERDLEKYENVVERNKINGSKGGRPNNPKKPKETQKTQLVIPKPKKADNDNDNDNESDKEKKKSPSVECSSLFKSYLVFAKTYTPKLLEMKKPLKDEELTNLNNLFGRENVKEVFLAMQNSKDLLKKYESVYLTAMNWLKIRGEKNNNNSISKNVEVTTINFGTKK